jgi:hypothetical protein
MENTNMEDSKQNSQTSQNSSLQTKFNNLNPSSEDNHTQDMETNSRAPLKNIDQNGTTNRRYRWPVGSKKRNKRQNRTMQKKEKGKIYDSNAFVSLRKI